MFEIKTHMNDKYEDDNIIIIHGKQDRNNYEEINTTEHRRFYLFPKDA